MSPEAAHQQHVPGLAHHFDSLEQQTEATTLGMWVFLVTEVLFFGGLHYWWPKMSGRLYNEGLAKLSAGIIFVGFNLTFFPQFVVGYMGMPRRYHSYPEEFQVLNVLSSAGASILGVGYLIPMVYLMWSLRYGRVAGSNPWGAVGLEWLTTSPPPTENFAETPIVTWDAYEYPARVESHVA